MTIEQVKALVRELVADGILYASVAHNIDWAKYEDECFTRPLGINT